MLYATRLHPYDRAPVNDKPRTDPRVAVARRTLLEGVGAEVASSFPGITRLGGQVVAALYLAETPRSMDQLAEELGCAKSNIFGNLRALEAAGIVKRLREPGVRHDSFALKGPYPDVIIGAYVARLRWVVADKVALSDRALDELGDADGAEAESLRKRLASLRKKYVLFGEVFQKLLPMIEGPIDLERFLSKIPSGVFDAVGKLAKEAFRLTKKAKD